MKPLFIVISVLAVLPVSAADPQPFSSAPLQLQLPPSEQLQLQLRRSAPLSVAYAPFPVVAVRLDLPIGPVRIDYGTPLPSEVFQSNDPQGYHFRYYFLDAPGAGYREQRDRTNHK